MTHNCTEFAIIKNLLFSSAKIFENNIVDIVAGITLRGNLYWNNRLTKFWKEVFNKKRRKEES